MGNDCSVPRIVLDTNVCLDLLVFRDPACLPLHDALQRGVVHAMTRTDCRDEWLRVLHYPGLPVDDASRPALVAAFDAWTHLAPASPTAAVAPPLPRCADPDDQKFLELAWETGARWLLSKDKELLKLARAQRVCRFAILRPQEWSLVEPQHPVLDPP